MSRIPYSENGEISVKINAIRASCKGGEQVVTLRASSNPPCVENYFFIYLTTQLLSY